MSLFHIAYASVLSCLVWRRLATDSRTDYTSWDITIFSIVQVILAVTSGFNCATPQVLI